MSERPVLRMDGPKVRHDVALLGDFTRMWCDAHHAGRDRAPIDTEGARAGVYRRIPVLCDECAAHLAYAEKRRARCTRDPKPFCSQCDTHCYSAEHRRWQREVMRYAGPRSWHTRHVFEGIRHVMAAARSREERNVR